MTVETVEESKNRVQHFNVDTLTEDTTIKSLILAIDQKQPGAHITLYIDCVSQGMVATPRSLRDMYEKMVHPKIDLVSPFGKAEPNMDDLCKLLRKAPT